VEAKEFEMVVRTGAYGVRIFERNKGKQRSFFIQKEELEWLVHNVEVLVSVVDFEVFLDQSRVGYPRIIAQ
jgi:hypothetical protein